MTLEWEIASRERVAREEGREEGHIEALKMLLNSLSVDQIIAAGFSPEEIERARQ